MNDTIEHLRSEGFDKDTAENMADVMEVAKNKVVFAEYQDVVKQIKDLEKVKDTLKDIILQKMEAIGVKTMKFEMGTFTVTEIKKWEYSEETQLIADQLKDRKKVEEQNGKAKIASISHSLRFQDTGDSV